MTIDLLIVGCGPVGAVAANLAGAAGLSTVVVERGASVFDLPRAIHFDAHVMRILQQAGVADEVLPYTRVWKRSTSYGVDGKPIRVHEWAQQRTQGWDSHYLFYQPALEQTLRTRLAARENVTLRPGTEVIGVEQDDDLVTVHVRESATGRPYTLTARYLMAADGASSFVRTELGVKLVDEGFDEPWMVIDLLCDREIGRPDESEMFCNPYRPATRVPGPGKHHRWEFMLLPGETTEQMEQPEAIERLLRPWVSIDEVRILRASVYRFHALVAERWRDGRIFLVGDAAHQTPVFLGQGLCHGIRDAQNLMWKLAAALRGATAEPLLASFETERRPHVETIIGMSVNAGRDICLLDPKAAAQRDARIRRDAAAGRLPSTTFQGMPPLHGGLFTRRGGGELFPQPRVRSGGRTTLMDDVIGDQPALVALSPASRELSKLASVLHIERITTESDGLGHAVTDPAELRGWLRDREAAIAVLRSDHYVHLLTNDAAEAAEALRELHKLTGGAADRKTVLMERN